MLSDALVLLIFIILIIAFFAYFMIKDKENLKRIMILEQTLDEFTQDLHYLKKDNVILSEIKAKLQEEMDQKIDTLQLILEDALNAKTSLQIDARILPILESLKEVELIIKDFQADQQNRILDLEQRTRSISKISPNFDNEEAKVIAMSKAGKSIEQIAKDMKLGVGRVELILKFNKKGKKMLEDSYGRRINYLRISLTSKCNFRCLYCMPNTPFNSHPRENLLSYEELFLFIKVAIDEGVNKIRLTGGEPLVRHDVDRFIKMINDYKSGIDLALTTNGFFLEKMAKPLKAAGLKRLNISLDTLKREKAAKLQNKDCLPQVLKGIEAALKEDFKIKLNTVALKGVNEDELLALLDFAKEKNMMIRFIEFMENSHAYGPLKGLCKDEILSLIGQKYVFTECEKEANSPASLYELEDGYKFGIIDPHSHNFCDTCNRIRLSAEGLLIPCLYFDEALSIKEAVRKGDIEKAANILKEVISQKPEKNRWDALENEVSNRAFYETGG